MIFSGEAKIDSAMDMYCAHALIHDAVTLNRGHLFKFLLRNKANLNIRTLKNLEHGFHRDHPWNGKTSVFYLNDNDGYTKFQNGQVVKSKANRAVIFDSPELHTGSTPTDVYARYVINLNWVEDGSPQIVADDMPLTQKLIAEKTLNSE